MNIIPFKSVGVLTFGDSRAVSGEKLASSFSTFQKDVGEKEADAFDDRGLHLYYSEEGDLEFVEAFDPAEPVLCGIRFLGRDLNSVIAEMLSLGFAPKESDVGVKFDTTGIALTAPTGIVEGVGVHRKGYYDQ